MKNLNTKEKAILITQRLNELLPDIESMDADDPFKILVADNVQTFNVKTKYEGYRYIPIVLRDSQLSLPSQDIGYNPESLNLNIYIPDMKDEKPVLEVLSLYKQLYNQKQFNQTSDGFILELVADPKFISLNRSTDGRNKYTGYYTMAMVWNTVKGYLSSFDSSLVIDEVEYNPMSVSYAQYKDKSDFILYNTDITNYNLVNHSMTVVLPINQELLDSRLFKSVHDMKFNQLFRIDDTYGDFSSSKDWELQSGTINRVSGDLSIFTALFIKPLPRKELTLIVSDGDQIIVDDPLNPIIYLGFTIDSNTNSHLRADDQRNIRAVKVRRGKSFSLQFLHVEGNPLSESLAYQAINQTDNHSMSITYKVSGLEYVFNDVSIYGGVHATTATGGVVFSISMAENAGDN